MSSPTLTKTSSTTYMGRTQDRSTSCMGMWDLVDGPKSNSLYKDLWKPLMETPKSRTTLRNLDAYIYIYGAYLVRTKFCVRTVRTTVFFFLQRRVLYFIYTHCVLFFSTHTCSFFFLHPLCSFFWRFIHLSVRFIKLESRFIRTKEKVHSWCLCIKIKHIVLKKRTQRVFTKNTLLLQKKTRIIRS